MFTWGALIMSIICWFGFMLASVSTIYKNNILKKERTSTLTREDIRREAGIFVWTYFLIYEKILGLFYRQLPEQEADELAEYKAFVWTQLVLWVVWFIVWLFIFW